MQQTVNNSSSNMDRDTCILWLQELSQTLRSSPQVIETHKELALQLSADYFTMHSSNELQLLTAFCITDILRLYRSRPPYTQDNQIKRVSKFLIRQLVKLKDHKEPLYQRYVTLLDKYLTVNVFSIIFQLDDWQEMYYLLFETMFKVASPHQSQDVKSMMIDILVQMICVVNNIKDPSIDLHYISLVQAAKNNRIEPFRTYPSYDLVRGVITKSIFSLEEYIIMYLKKMIIAENFSAISTKLFDILSEMIVNYPLALVNINALFGKQMKTGKESKRLGVTAVVANFFTKNSTYAKSCCNELWTDFLQQFNDVAVSIRIKCVRSCVPLLLQNPQLHTDIVAALKCRQQDFFDSVRYDVIWVIVELIEKKFEILSKSPELLECIKDGTLDKQFRIRKEAMIGLAIIYEKYVNSDIKLTPTNIDTINWIKEKILNSYHTDSVEDRLLVENLLIRYLVPYQLPPKDRMKKLFCLLITIGGNATKAFVRMHKEQIRTQNLINEWIRLHSISLSSSSTSSTSTTSSLSTISFDNNFSEKHLHDINQKCSIIAKQFRDPIKMEKYLLQFSDLMRSDKLVVDSAEIILRRDVTRKEFDNSLVIILEKIGQPSKTNLYYDHMKKFFERLISKHVDKHSIAVFIELVNECVPRKGCDSAYQNFGYSREQLCQRALKTLVTLSQSYSASFYCDSILTKLLQFFKFKPNYISPYILEILTNIGNYKRLYITHQNICEKLLPICTQYTINGTPLQAKHAVRCMAANIYINGDKPIEAFSRIIYATAFTQIKEANFRTVCVTIGQIAVCLPKNYRMELHHLICQRIIKELLVYVPEKKQNHLKKTDVWCTKERLPECTRCKVEGIKTIARWLIGTKNDLISAKKVFRLLNAVVRNKGDLLKTGELTAAEMSWLRLSAGKAMLKICEHKALNSVANQMNTDQLFLMSELMTDPVEEVREAFAKRLHKGFSRCISHRCLPIELMGLYALGGREPNRMLAKKLFTYLNIDINRRRNYLRDKAETVTESITKFPHIVPDYIFVYAIPILAKDRNFTDPSDIIQLKQIEKCLWFIMKPLIKNEEYFRFNFYNIMIESIKHHKNAMCPNDDETNLKMWAICDIAKHILYTRSVNHDMTDYPVNAAIPAKYFCTQPTEFKNSDSFIPNDMYTTLKGRKKTDESPISPHTQTFDFSVFNQSGQWTILWKSIFQIINTATAMPVQTDIDTVFLPCLSAVRILSRNKMHLNQTTIEQFDCLLNIANIGSQNVQCKTEVSVEALKCLCNLVFQSETCQAMCLKNAAIEGIVKRLRTYKDHNVHYDLQYFDMKLLFIITGLNPNVRTKVRDDYHGLTYLVETLALIMRDYKSQSYLPEKQIDLLCEILKVLFNITVRNETSIATEEEEEIQFRRLAVVLHDLLLCKSYSKEKQNDLCSNTINLLTNVPTACYSELVLTLHDDEYDTKGLIAFEGNDMTAIDVLLNFLRGRLDNTQKVSTQQEYLSPILMTLVKCVRCNTIQRRYIRTIVLPPLRDVSERPEVGNELRNHLCRLLTTPATQVRDLSAELLFVLCKENVSRMTKYTGYGNAAGLFANRGLLGGHGAPSTEYSSDSEDSDTEEYKQIQHAINPVLGCYEAPRPNPFEGMSEEQKEYEAMKLVNLMDQLNRQGVVQPCRIGADGRPEPVDHILELQEGIPQQQMDHKRKT